MSNYPIFLHTAAVPYVIISPSPSSAQQNHNKELKIITWNPSPDQNFPTLLIAFRDIPLLVVPLTYGLVSP